MKHIKFLSFRYVKFMHLFALTWLLLIPPIIAQDLVCKVLSPNIAGIYEGQCRNGLAHGIGKSIGIDAYEGAFIKGLPHGAGKCVYESGSFYEGEWKKGLMDGFGTFYDFLNDTTLTGIWKKGDFIRSKSPYIPRDIQYQVVLRRNIDRYRFHRISDGDRVKISFAETSSLRPVQNLTIDGSSGSYYKIARESGFENIAFPFAGKVRFLTYSKMKTAIIECEIHFTIHQPGYWEFTITY
ncbi:MAG: hypothetical protein U1C46_04350 [Bacteroidales bacterium]|nr:hypothetical protein [Bacteroidales bacterium]MDZ4204034.1 hypothetical protein [Bacteroidales bacterium]